MFQNFFFVPNMDQDMKIMENNKNENKWTHENWSTYLSSIVRYGLNRLYLHPIDLEIRKRPFILSNAIQNIQDDLDEPMSESDIQFLQSLQWESPIWKCSKIHVKREFPMSEILHPESMCHLKNIVFEWKVDVSEETEPQNQWITIEDIVVAIYRLKTYKEITTHESRLKTQNEFLMDLTILSQSFSDQSDAIHISIMFAAHE